MGNEKCELCGEPLMDNDEDWDEDWTVDAIYGKVHVGCLEDAKAKE